MTEPSHQGPFAQNIKEFDLPSHCKQKGTFEKEPKTTFVYRYQNWI